MTSSGPPCYVLQVLMCKEQLCCCAGRKWVSPVGGWNRTSLYDDCKSRMSLIKIITADSRLWNIAWAKLNNLNHDQKWRKASQSRVECSHASGLPLTVYADWEQTRGGLNYTSINNMYRDLNVFNEVGCIFKWINVFSYLECFILKCVHRTKTQHEH